MLWMRKVETLEAIVVRCKTCEILDEIRPYIKSVTGDNVKEFVDHQYITDQYCDFFFANPYSPWERDSNENLNGLIRQYIQKITDFSPIGTDKIIEIQNKLNSRPRKRCNYETPIFIMENLLFNSEAVLMS
jgi:IS30 family transposase